MAEAPKKKPILPTLTRLAGEALVETIDGPVEIVKLVGKVMPVLTRFEGGELGFRMMTQIRELEPEAAVLRVTNGDGQSLRVGLDHVFVRDDGSEVRAADLEVGDRLDSGWSYPEGYELPDAGEYAQGVRGAAWSPSVVVASIDEDQPGPLYGFSVKETKSYYLTFGARSRAQE